METKKISELEQVETLSENANVLVEDGNGAKRFPAKKISAVKTVSGIAPDENGNVNAVDAAARADIANLKNYVTPQMYGYESGDVSDYLNEALATGMLVRVPNGAYTISKEVSIPEGGAVVFDSNAVVTLTEDGKIILDRLAKVSGGQFDGTAVPTVFELRHQRADGASTWMEQAKVSDCYIKGSIELTTAISINTTDPYVSAMFCTIENVHIAKCRCGVMVWEDDTYSADKWSTNHKIDICADYPVTSVYANGNGCFIRVTGESPKENEEENTCIVVSGSHNIIETAVFDVGNANHTRFLVELTKESSYNTFSCMLAEYDYWRVNDRGVNNCIENKYEHTYSCLRRTPDSGNNMLACALERGIATFTYNNASGGEYAKKYMFHSGFDANCMWITIQPGGDVTIDVTTETGVYAAGMVFGLQKAVAGVGRECYLYYTEDGATYIPVVEDKLGDIHYAFGSDGNKIVGLRFVIKNSGTEEYVCTLRKIYAVGEGRVSSYLPTQGGVIYGQVEIKEKNTPLIIPDVNGNRWGVTISTDGQFVLTKL